MNNSTATIIAKKHGISKTTVMRDAIGEENPELKQEILSGKPTLTKKDNMEIEKSNDEMDLSSVK